MRAGFWSAAAAGALLLSLLAGMPDGGRASPGDDGRICGLVPHFSTSLMWSQVAAATQLAVSDVKAKNCSIISENCESLLSEMINSDVDDINVLLEELGNTVQEAVRVTDHCVRERGGNMAFAIATPDVASAVTLLTSSFDVPQTMPTWFTALTYPVDSMLLSTIHSDRLGADAALGLMRKFGWKKVGLLYNVINGQMIANELSSLMEPNGFAARTTSYKASSYSDTIMEALGELKLQDERVIFLVDPGGPTDRVLLAAADMGLTGRRRWHSITPFTPSSPLVIGARVGTTAVMHSRLSLGCRVYGVVLMV